MSEKIKSLLLPQRTAKSNHYPGLNAVKGILILLVIFTHSMPHGMMLYFNYLFHMPLFLAISGFLLKQSAFEKGLKYFLGRLTQRLILPWLIASLCYTPFVMQAHGTEGFTLTDFLYPFYHLWYVPAYFLGVLLCYAVLKLKINAWLVLGISAVLTFLWYIFYRENPLPVTEQPLYWLGDKRFYSYLFFFFLGFALRNGLITCSVPPLLLLLSTVGAFTAIVPLAYLRDPYGLLSLLYIVFNGSLVLFVLVCASHKSWFQNKLILLINRQSLGIYLYHPAIIFTIYALLGDPFKEHVNNLQGLVVGGVTLVSVLSLIWLLQKWEVTNLFLLGIRKKKKQVEMPFVRAAA